jgi:hypothetical protein
VGGFECCGSVSWYGDDLRALIQMMKNVGNFLSFFLSFVLFSFFSQFTLNQLIFKCLTIYILFTYICMHAIVHFFFTIMIFMFFRIVLFVLFYAI